MLAKLQELREEENTHTHLYWERGVNQYTRIFTYLNFSNHKALIKSIHTSKI